MTKPRFARRLAGTAIAAAIVVVSGVGSASAVGECMPRYLAQNIREAVLASKAVRYCPGLPYTHADVERRIAQLRCNDRASALIDELLAQYEYEYKNVLIADGTQLICHMAADFQLL